MGREVFSIISEQNLRDVLSNLNKFTELPIRLIDIDGSTLLSYGKFPGYCAKLQETIFTERDCICERLKAGMYSHEIGETYIFSCHGNMNYITFPIISGANLMGSVIIGPFLLDNPDSTVVIGLSEKYPINPALSLELYDCLSDIPVVMPGKVNNLKVLLDYLMSSLMPTERAALQLKQQQMYQQAKINESIQAYKEETGTTDLKFRYEKEKELMSIVKTGDVRSAKAVLNELIGNAVFCGGGAAEIRQRAIELTTLLSRVAMDGGANPENIYEMSGKYISKLGREEGFVETCVILQDVVENFMSAAFYEKDKGNSYIRKALSYITENYRQHITLEDVAKYVGLSASYFSSMFNSVLKTSFKEYLNMLRIEEAKRLLLSTDYELADVAVFIGYPDQSYFTKIFRKMTGTSPSLFRKKMG